MSYNEHIEEFQILLSFLKGEKVIDVEHLDGEFGLDDIKITRSDGEYIILNSWCNYTEPKLSVNRYNKQGDKYK